MTRLAFALVILFAAAAGCANYAPAGIPAPAVSAAPTASATAGTTATATQTGSPYVVRYDWAVPSREVTIEHPKSDAVPVTLVEVRTGDHARENPGYARITFAFERGYPDYRFAYVPEVTMDGSGDPVRLAGNAFLHVVFFTAMAHDDQTGRSTIRYASDRNVGLRNLVAYAPAGDYEGYVSYGLGTKVASGSDQALPIRVGELRRADGLYVIAVDVRAG